MIIDFHLEDLVFYLQKNYPTQHNMNSFMNVHNEAYAYLNYGKKRTSKIR